MSILDRLKKGAFFFADFGGFSVDLRSDDDIAIIFFNGTKINDI